MKILHVIANLAPRYGGPSKACVEIAQAVAQRGHEVHIFTTNQDGTGVLGVPTDHPVRNGDILIHYFPAQIRRFWMISLPMAAALRDHIRDYDLVHIHSLYLFHGLIAAHYCRKWRIPYVLRPHGTLDPFIRNRHRFRKWLFDTLFERRNFRGASAVHFTTEDEQRLAQPFVFGARGFVVPLGLNVSDYASLPPPGTFLSAFPQLAGKRIVLFLGRINFKKGFDILIPAFSQVLGRIPSAHLVIAGPDSESFGSTVLKWIRNAGITEHVTFVGMVEGEMKLAAFRDSSVFVLPSYSENFGIAVIEAMACGLPVIVSDQVNICNEIQNAGAGLVISCSVEQCARAIEVVLNDEKRAIDFGQRGSRLVHNYFSTERLGRELTSEYEKIADDTSTR